MGNTPIVISKGRNNVYYLMKGLLTGIEEYKLAAAQLGVQVAQSYFDTGGPPSEPWRPLHEWTEEKKGTNKPLVDTRSLQQSIRVIRIGKGVAFGSTHPLAPVHENGVTIRVTSRMRRYLAANGMFLGPFTRWITIPKRPFLEPAADQIKEELPDLCKDILNKNMKVVEPIV